MLDQLCAPIKRVGQAGECPGIVARGRRMFRFLKPDLRCTTEIWQTGLQAGGEPSSSHIRFSLPNGSLSSQPIENN
jgi:hypothetical protein